MTSAASSTMPLQARGCVAFVDGPQPVAGDVSVDLGRRQIGVAEQLLHGPQVGSAFEQVRSVRVPQRVGVEGPPVGQRMALEDPAGVPRA